MSKWTNEFDNHPFQAVWEELNDAVSRLSLDDETVSTSVEEVSRLRKVVRYLSELIKGIDPELVPMSIWDSFNQQATAANNELINFHSNRNVGHITNANNHADNLLTYVRPYMVLPKSAAQAAGRAASAYAKSAEEYVTNLGEQIKTTLRDVQALKSAADSDSSEIKSTKQNIAAFENELFGEDKASGIKRKIEELLSDAKSKQGSINEVYNEVLVGEGDEPSTKQEIAAAKSSSIEKRQEIEQLLAAANEERSDLGKFHIKIFGEENGDGARVGGLDKQLESLKERLTDFEGSQAERYKALNDEIESLLPGATSAGLATAYSEMKGSFDKPIKDSGRLFFISIGVLVVASFTLAVQSIGLTQITFREIDTWDSVLKSFSYKLPIFAPIVWLAFYATKRRSEAQRLQQEYAHKESLAKSYNSYKKQIEELGENDEKLLSELIRKAIDAISHNASATLDGKHGDKMPAQEAVDFSAMKLGGS